MELNPQDRRQYVRVPLLAYGQDKTCTLEFGGKRCKADLIDISSGGARLRLIDPPAGVELKALIVSVAGVNDNGILQNLASALRWRSGQEIGVQFEEELHIAMSTLQRLVG